MSTLSIKFISKDDELGVRRKGDHIVIVPPHQHFACWHCGYWMSPHPESSSYGVSFRMYRAMLKAFQADHRSCKPQPEGREHYIWLNTEWDNFMESHPKDRAEWEKDCGRVWARRDWGAEYDAWLSLPYEKKERKKDDTRQPGAVE